MMIVWLAKISLFIALGCLLSGVHAAHPAMILENSVDENEEQKEVKRLAVKNDHYLWTMPIGYAFAKTISLEEKTSVLKAMKFLESTTCLTFEERTTGDYIEFFNGEGCYSALGRSGGKQSISLGNGCHYPNLIIHEIEHAIGFIHEHERFDRDKFIKINLDNVQEGSRFAYEIMKSKLTTLNNLPYDYGSVMHYDQEGFSINSHIPTIVTIDGKFQKTIGQYDYSSFLDIYGINKRYSCNCNGKQSPKCVNGGYPNPANCSVCLCPTGFAGVNCASLPKSTVKTCGGILKAAQDWKYFEGYVGKYLGNYTECYYHIQAACGKKVEVEITYLNIRNGHCPKDVCHFDALELKIDSDYRKSGFRSCCPKENVNTTFVSSTSIVPMVAWSLNRLDFQIKYRLAQ